MLKFSRGKMIIQPTLFEINDGHADIEEVLLYALGEFQSRKKLLADRELPLDRLRGAFKRASEKFRIDELNDREIAENLKKIGAKIVEVPNYVAKHPFRVTISNELAVKSGRFYQQSLEDERIKNS